MGTRLKRRTERRLKRRMKIARASVVDKSIRRFGFSKLPVPNKKRFLKRRMATNKEKKKIRIYV
jgi:hypothetical protein